MSLAERWDLNMKISCLQMDMKLGSVDENFKHAKELIRNAAVDNPDVVILPETWNTGFFPHENLYELSCKNGDRVKTEIGGLAKELNVNIVAGSVSNVHDDRIYNTAFIFNRDGECVAEYDKTHLFTPMGEDEYYKYGESLCTFTLDGIQCGIIICYDLRFPELVRSLALSGINVLFVVSQWPKERIFHLHSLLTGRAIENQMFVVCCNSCGTAGETIYGGKSAIIDPLGNCVALANEKEEILVSDCDIQSAAQTRCRIPVFYDRRPELYKL